MNIQSIHFERESRLGAPKAITATAHKIAIIIYNMLKHGVEYVETAMIERALTQTY